MEIQDSVLYGKFRLNHQLQFQMNLNACKWTSKDKARENKVFHIDKMSDTPAEMYKNLIMDIRFYFLKTRTCFPRTYSLLVLIEAVRTINITNKIFLNRNSNPSNFLNLFESMPPVLDCGKHQTHFQNISCSASSINIYHCSSCIGLVSCQTCSKSKT